MTDSDQGQSRIRIADSEDEVFAHTAAVLDKIHKAIEERFQSMPAMGVVFLLMDREGNAWMAAGGSVDVNRHLLKSFSDEIDDTEEEASMGLGE